MREGIIALSTDNYNGQAINFSNNVIILYYYELNYNIKHHSSRSASAQLKRERVRIYVRIDAKRQVQRQSVVRTGERDLGAGA